MSQRHLLFMLGGAAIGYYFGKQADASDPTGNKTYLYAALGAAAGWFAAKYV